MPVFRGLAKAGQVIPLGPGWAFHNRNNSVPRPECKVFSCGAPDCFVQCWHFWNYKHNQYSKIAEKAHRWLESYQNDPVTIPDYMVTFIFTILTIFNDLVRRVTL